MINTINISYALKLQCKYGIKTCKLQIIIKIQNYQSYYETKWSEYNYSNVMRCDEQESVISRLTSDSSVVSRQGRGNEVLVTKCMLRSQQSLKPTKA